MYSLSWPECVRGVCRHTHIQHEAATVSLTECNYSCELLTVGQNTSEVLQTLTLTTKKAKILNVCVRARTTCMRLVNDRVAESFLEKIKWKDQTENSQTFPFLSC